MRTLNQDYYNQLGAVPAGAIITGASNVISSIFGNSAAKKAAQAQTAIANSQSSIAALQERMALSNQSFELSKLETERKARTQTLLIVGGLVLAVTGVGVAVYLSNKNDKVVKAK
ncbi:MAG: hypothetical protein KF856_15775 [Cyclobacteriaceae bacterium]|nr:hypothetical protein [Cyclobacteriaceae bacterium]